MSPRVSSIQLSQRSPRGRSRSVAVPPTPSPARPRWVLPQVLGGEQCASPGDEGSFKK